jgi:hypothetical protein
MPFRGFSSPEVNFFRLELRTVWVSKKKFLKPPQTIQKKAVVVKLVDTLS